MPELDAFLMPVNSPIQQNQGQTNTFVFDYTNEAGVISTQKIQNAAITQAKIGAAAIGSAQIGTISFNQVSGGSATLGGTVNGNGLLSVVNSGGTEVVRLDNNGITISQGSITNVTVSTVSISQGTVNNSIIGTPALTGGTLNPGKYQYGGTAGVTGTFTYLTAGTVAGTIIVLGGIVTTIS